MEPKRILHFQGRMGKGGAETFMMNVYRNLDRTQFQFDFLIYDDFETVQPYHEEIKKLGGHIYVVPNPKKHLFRYMREVKALLESGAFAVVHNEVFFGGGINLYLAKQAGIPIRVAHSHATSHELSGNPIFRFVNGALKKLLLQTATDYVACSHEAGLALFGENQPFELIPNGIDLTKYTHVPLEKHVIRESLGIEENAFVMGNIGRFEHQKNHVFLIDIFAEVRKQHPNSYLLLIGEGSLIDKIKAKVAEKNLSEHVLFLGLREDIPELLKAMDVLIMPSLYEGLPISAVEAQAAGIKLVLSSEISKDTQLSENVVYVPLKESTKKWAEIALTKPYTNQPLPALSQYDMHYTTQLMEAIYADKEDVK